MLNLCFDPSHDTRQSTQGDSQTVSAQRPPDFEPIQQTLSVNREGVAIVEFVAPSKQATGQIP